MIRLTPAQWEEIRARLREEYPPSVTLIRSVMRRELGFTTREHQEWTGKRIQSVVFLDFFDDRLESWFVLKYAEHL